MIQPKRRGFPYEYYEGKILTDKNVEKNYKLLKFLLLAMDVLLSKVEKTYLLI